MHARRRTAVIAVLVAVGLLGVAAESNARVDPCKRACAVVFKRGGSNCQKKVKSGIKKRQKACRQDFAQTGFSSVQKCRTEARRFGMSLIQTCKGSRAAACETCCSNGGTKETCAPRSPSGAFLDLAGPLL
jgi:hypothetical protein